MDNTMKTIYIADDDDMIRRAIRLFLEKEGYQVCDFAAGDALLEAFALAQPDLVILDVMMPGMDGFTVCQEIRKTSIVPIIMLTARDSDLDFAMGINLGSDDYFTKPFSPMALVLRVKAIFRRIDFEQQKHLTGKREEEELRCGMLRLIERGRKLLVNEQEITLSPNEYDVLHYLMKHFGQAVSREELLEKVWGYETAVETRATDDTVHRLRKKLERTDAEIEAIWGYGFRLKGRKT